MTIAPQINQTKHIMNSVKMTPKKRVLFELDSTLCDSPIPRITQDSYTRLIETNKSKIKIIVKYETRPKK